VLSLGFVAVLAGEVGEQSCGPGAILAQPVPLSFWEKGLCSHAGSGGLAMALRRALALVASKP
jgi:hypothetical protein